MRAELREKVLDQLDELSRWAGTSDFQTTVKDFRRLMFAFLERTESMQTREQLAELLEQLPEPTFAEEKLILGSLKLMPQLMSYGLKKLAQKAAEDVPVLPTGRPRMEFQKRAEIVMYIGQLNVRGTSLEACKKRAAQRFNCSVSTVERIWIERGQIDEVDLRSAIKWWSEQT